MRHKRFAPLLVLPLLTGAMTLASSASAAPSAAAVPAMGLQDCGHWRYPVPCRVELRVRSSTSSWEDYDPDEALAIPPRGDLDIQIVGRDQDGRGFPQDRLTLGFEDRDCRSALDIEQRGEGTVRISARCADGRCRLELYVPGNLDFAWRIDAEVYRDIASGYERDEAEVIVGALYRGILGRDADAGSLSGAVSEAQRGRLEAQVQAMLRSGEFLQSAASTTPAELLDKLYQGLLERSPDSTGVRDLLPQLERRRYLDVVLAILRSAEFEERFLQ